MVQQASGGIVTPPTGTDKEKYDFVITQLEHEPADAVGSTAVMTFDVWYDLPNLRKEALVNVSLGFARRRDVSLHGGGAGARRSLTGALAPAGNRRTLPPIRERSAMSVSQRFRVPAGKKFRLSDHDPADTGGMETKKEAKDRLEKGIERMRELQEMLYAQDCWALLLIFQAMDAAGKDSTIEHVMSGVNPQGCQVYSFKAPSNGGAGPRLPVAHQPPPARARPHRHLQPLVLRGGAGGARAPGDPAQAAPARPA